jgi:hypothetical protein
MMNRRIKRLRVMGLGLLIALGLVIMPGTSWAAQIDTTVGTAQTFDFTNIPANLQIVIAGSTPASMGGTYPNNTQTFPSPSGTFSIIGTGPNYSLDHFLLLITRPTLPTSSFDLTPILGGTSLSAITVAPGDFVTSSNNVSISGNTPGGGSFNALGPASHFAFVDLFGVLSPSATHASGLNPFNPTIGVGFANVPGLTTFIAYGATNGSSPDLVRRSAFSESLTITPIPEPGTLLLIGSGLVGIGVGARRRRKQP